MNVLANDATAAAVLTAVPCYPVPHIGRSPVIDALRASRTGHGVAIGRDGVMMIVRRPWLALDMPIAEPFDAYLPYGSVGDPVMDLRCGLIPRAHLVRILAHFEAALPNEAAAFVLWHEQTGEFRVELPVIDEATPSRLVYRTPVCAPGWHVVCDMHSHGRGMAFFSTTDDADDAHATKFSVVVGGLDHAEGLSWAQRLCAVGMFIPFPRSIFAGGHHAA